MDIVLDYDTSANSAPSGFKTAMQFAANYLDSLILNPITVTIDVGYGEVDGESLNFGTDLGAAVPNTDLVSYSQVKSALAADATTSAAQTAAANLPSSDPTGGVGITVAYAQEQAWGLLPANDGEVDGYVGFGAESNGPGGVTYDFNTGGSVPQGEYYFVGIAEHELTHVLGRISDIGYGYAGNGGTDTVLDLFQYTVKGDIAPVTDRMESSYFSINGGATDLGTFDDTSDPGDWAQGHAADSFDADGTPGAVELVSATDVEEMNAIGFEVACFAAGTRIATVRGEVAVEELRAGRDLAITAEGRAAPIVWTGWRRVSPGRHAQPTALMPVRVRRGAIGPGQPARDLMLSPDHALALDGALIPVRYLVNGRTIVQEPAEAITFWHVELDRHDVLLAEGLTAESFLDTGNRTSFANVGPIVRATPEFARARWATAGCLPLVLEGPRLLQARARLLRRAASLGWRTTTEPALRVLADREELVARQAGGRWSVTLPRGTRTVRLLSRVWVPADAEPGANDHRRLGVALGALWLDGRAASLDSPALLAGWHAPEPGWRWTDGEATLRAEGIGAVAFTLAMTGRYAVDDGAGGRGTLRRAMAL